MDIRPQDLPELRAELLDHYRSPQGITEWSQRTFHPASIVPDTDGTFLVCDPSPEERRTAEVSRLAAADLYFVSDSMAQLASEAGKTLPAFSVDEMDLPSSRGLMLFEHPLHDVIVEQDGTEAHIQAVSWGIARNSELGASLWLSFYANLDHSRGQIEDQYGPVLAGVPKLFYSLDCEWSFDADHTPGDRDALHIWGRAVISAWLLMRQPLAVEEDLEPPRPVRKRLTRAGHEPTAVRVIELRRPQRSGEAGPGTREYHHAWVVRGHWRQQWHPKRQVHRPVWIAPHIKGPEGAPLIGGEKVYALKR